MHSLPTMSVHPINIDICIELWWSLGQLLWNDFFCVYVVFVLCHYANLEFLYVDILTESSDYHLNLFLALPIETLEKIKPKTTMQLMNTHVHI